MKSHVDSIVLQKRLSVAAVTLKRFFRQTEHLLYYLLSVIRVTLKRQLESVKICRPQSPVPLDKSPKLCRQPRFFAPLRCFIGPKNSFSRFFRGKMANKKIGLNRLYASAVTEI